MAGFGGGKFICYISKSDHFERVQYPEDTRTNSFGCYVQSMNPFSDKCPFLSKLSIYHISFHVTDSIWIEKKNMLGESFRKKKYSDTSLGSWVGSKQKQYDCYKCISLLEAWMTNMTEVKCMTGYSTNIHL
jgi:hypothetical protein